MACGLLKFLAIFLRRLVPWPSVDMQGRFYEDRPSVRGSRRKRGSPNIAILDLLNDISRKRCKIGGKLVLITNEKSYMSFRLVPKSVTLNDLERWPLFSVILWNLVVSGANCLKTITMDYLRILCLIVNVFRGTARRLRYKFLADS